MLQIASNVAHDAVTMEDFTGIDVFSQIREDWRGGNDDYLRRKLGRASGKCLAMGNAPVITSCHSPGPRNFFYERRQSGSRVAGVLPGLLFSRAGAVGEEALLGVVGEGGAETAQRFALGADTGRQRHVTNVRQ